MARRTLISALTIALVLVFVFTCATLPGCSSESSQEPVIEKEAEDVDTMPDEDEDEDEAEETSEVEDEDEEQDNDETAAPDADDEQAVTQVAIAAARSNNPDLPELTVLDVKVINGWARVDLEPVDKSTDAASAYLKKEGGTWVVFDFGTGIGPDLYPEVPPELFK